MNFSASTASMDMRTVPHLVWELYIDHLWNWSDHPGSLVSRIAYISRVLAILLILPIVVLTLLDLASYGIARTLGVIDVTSASTSDEETIHNKVPSVKVYEPSPASASFSTDPTTARVPTAESDMGTTTSSTDSLPPLTLDFNIGNGMSAPSHPDAYFTSEENSLRLSGVGVFSPAASRPPSPTITRRTLQPDDKLSVTEVDEGITFRKRKPTPVPAVWKEQGRDEQ